MAIEQVAIFQGKLEGEADGYLLDTRALVDFEQGSGDILIAVLDRDHSTVARSSVKFDISNPLFTSALATAVGAFAACVAAGLAGVAATSIHQAYAESKKDKPSLSKSKRCADLIERLKRMGMNLKVGASGAVASCLATVGLS